MALATVKWVADVHREYPTKHGQKAAFRVQLEDGRMGEVTTNADTVDKRMAQFKEIVGKPTELVIEDAGTWDDGNPKPVKVKFPQASPGSSNGGGGSSWYNSEEGVRFTQERTDRRMAIIQERTDRRTALMQAVEIFTGKQPTDANQARASVLFFADEFYSWLQGSAPHSAAPGESTVQTAQVPAPVTVPPDAQPSQEDGSPNLSVLHGSTDQAPSGGNGASNGDDAYGEGATTPEETAAPFGGATTSSAYITKDQQKELIRDYGSSKLVTEEFQKHFGERVRRVSDITEDMLTYMNEES